MPNLKGRYAVVTGASRGIGKGIALALGEAGATVFVTGRNKEAMAKVADLVTQAGGKGVPIECDHADDKQVAAVFQEIAAQTGGTLDVLVNNAFDAGITPEVEKLMNAKAKFYDLPLSAWDSQQRVGLRSHYVASYYAQPLLVAAARKATSQADRPLLCATSSFGAVAYLFSTAYGVAKAGSDRLMRDLQVELGPEGVDCLSLWPGVVSTEKMQELMRTDPTRVLAVTGGQDLEAIGESPALTGRVIARLAADAGLRKPPYTTSDGLIGRVAIVAEVAADLGIRDGGAADSTVGALYGPDRAPAPSIRSLGFLGPGVLRSKLPEPLKWLANPGGPLASNSVRLPLEIMAQGPPPPPS